MSLVTTPAILLRSHPYSESSRILRFCTRDLGVLGVMARGVRRGGREPGSFAGGELTLYLRSSRELQTFKEFAVSRPREGLGLGALRLGCAAVVAELVLRHGGEASSPPLFDALGSALDRIESAAEEDVLAVSLSGAWELVSVLGYEPVLDSCIQCDAGLGEEETGRFDLAAGGVLCPSCSRDRVGPRVGPGARGQLRALVHGGASTPPSLSLPRAHMRLLSDFITYHVSSGRPLDSFAFVARVLSGDDA